MNLALTAREQQVLSLMCDGLTRDQIANMLDIAPATVSSTTTHIFEKFGVHSANAAVAHAMRNGYVKVNKVQR